MKEAILRLENIGKAFGPVEVLRGISLQLQKGQVLGLVGENGAGKSTLMNVLGGIFPPSSGTMFFNRAVHAPESARDAQEAGIAFIHQELNLFPNLSIAENLFISDMPRQDGFFRALISRRRLLDQTRTALQEVGLDLLPQTLVGELSKARRQLVEIAKALVRAPRLIIFDEPTTALSRHEAERLFALIRQLQESGIAMIYISHHLEDVLAISDHIAVLRDGLLVSTGPAARYDKETLVRQMVGRELEQYFPERSGKPGHAACLEVRNLSSDAVQDISFTLQEGEILGFYGLIGAGRSELVRALYGLEAVHSGTVRWQDRPVDRLRPADWIRRGAVLLTEDRREEGLLLSKSITKNVQLAALPAYSSRPFGQLDYPVLREAAHRQTTATRVKYHDLKAQPVAQLSGGNQQKVVLSKWLLTDPKLLILDEPTKGIDIGAKEEIYQLINELADRGAGVLLISSEIEELLGLCDRILVLRNGRISGTFERLQFRRAAILEAALQVSPQNRQGT